MKRYILSTFLIAASSIIAHAQGDTLTNAKKKFFITATFFNHSISTPFRKIINKPLHPGVTLGTEARYFEKKRSKLFQAFTFGWFYNKYNMTGFYLSTDLGYRYTSDFGLFGEVQIGPGYLRSYRPTEIYTLNTSGNYEKTRDKGRSSPLIGFSGALGFKLHATHNISIAPFIKYQVFIQTRYSEEITVFPHSALHFGIRTGFN